MTATQTRCQRCRYLTSHCHCPQGPRRASPTPTPAPASGQSPELMTSGEVAAMFRVDPKTVTRWAQQGKVRSIRTPGGHRRYDAADIRAFLDGGQQ